MVDIVNHVMMILNVVQNVIRECPLYIALSRFTFKSFQAEQSRAWPPLTIRVCKVFKLTSAGLF